MTILANGWMRKHWAKDCTMVRAWTLKLLILNGFWSSLIYEGPPGFTFIIFPSVFQTLDFNAITVIFLKWKLNKKYISCLFASCFFDYLYSTSSVWTAMVLKSAWMCRINSKRIRIIFALLSNSFRILTGTRSYWELVGNRPFMTHVPISPQPNFKLTAAGSKKACEK